MPAELESVPTYLLCVAPYSLASLYLYMAVRMSLRVAADSTAARG